MVEIPVAQFINQHSFVLGALLLLLVAALFLFRQRVSPGDLIVLAALAAALLIGWTVLKPSQTVGGEVAEVQAQIGAGKPVLLEFQSPY